MKAILKIFGVAIAMATLTVAHAQSADTTATNTANIIPLIDLHEVPITAIIENLARQAGINYLVAPELEQTWQKYEPRMTFRLEKVTPQEALQRLLEVRGMTLKEDPISNIAFIIPTSQATNACYAGLSPATANALGTNSAFCPLIQFDDVPLTTAIENLARQSGVNYIIDQELLQQWNGFEAGQFEPQLAFRLANVTPWNTLNRLLAVRGLAIEPDPVTHVERITFRDEPLPVVDSSLLDLQTNNVETSSNNILPLIQFSDAPLEIVLENLIRESGLDIKLASALNDSKSSQLVNIRWTNLPAKPGIEIKMASALNASMPSQFVHVRWTDLTAKQAILALCENYNLAIVKNETTGVVEIQPAKTKPKHQPASP